MSARCEDPKLRCWVPAGPVRAQLVLSEVSITIQAMNFAENPYLPPASELDITPHKVRIKVSVARLVFALIVALSFTIFTVMLLSSRGRDHEAGRLYLLNVPVLLATVVAVIKSPRLSFWPAMLSVLVQVGITICMLKVPIGSPQPVIIVNSIVVAPMIILALWSGLANHSNRSDSLSEAA